MDTLPQSFNALRAYAQFVLWKAVPAKDKNTGQLTGKAARALPRA